MTHSVLILHCKLSSLYQSTQNTSCTPFITCPDPPPPNLISCLKSSHTHSPLFALTFFKAEYCVMSLLNFLLVCVLVSHVCLCSSRPLKESVLRSDPLTVLSYIFTRYSTSLKHVLLSLIYNTK